MSQLLVALLAGAIAAGSAVLVLRKRSPRDNLPKVPPALRPADIDAVLESDRLTRITAWGFVLTVFFAFFLPAYWIAEPAKRAGNEKKMQKTSLERGAKYFALRVDPVTGAENASGKECARCHGTNAQGGTNDFLNPNTNVRSVVQVPELRTVFSRYQNPPPGYKDARAFIYETIDRGRPGTDMPTWGNKNGGPLTEQELNDIVTWLQSIQQTPKTSPGASGQQIFTQICAACHGTAGAGGSGPPMKGGSETRQFPNIEDQVAFVKAGSKPGQPYGTSGKGTGGMPSWAPTLNDQQIRAVVDYERSL